eukprot:1173913-Prorocentrum_minimum.AAC.1
MARGTWGAGPLVRASQNTGKSVRAQAALWAAPQWPPEEWAVHEAAGAAAAAGIGAGNTHSPDVLACALAAHPRRPLLLSGTPEGCVVIVSSYNARG